MEFLKRQLNRIQEQLKGLTASQRMLTGALIVIAVMTLYWWANYAGRSEMEPVIDKALTPEEKSTITAQLRLQGIPYQVANDRINVPVDRKDEAFAGLAYAQALPQDTQDAFTETLSKSNLWMSNRMNDEMINAAKQTMLARYIRMWPGVANAGVIIDRTREHGPNGVQPTALVTIKLKSGLQPDRKMAESAADMVIGAVANLSRERVRVVINELSQRLRGAGGGSGGESEEYLEAMQRAERVHVERLQRLFSVIGDNVMISVAVNPNFKKVKIQKTEVDPKNVVQREVFTDNSTEENKASQHPSAEAGAQSNSPMMLAEGGGSGENSNNTVEKTHSESVVRIGETTTITEDPGGQLPASSAAVLAPRSYFLRTYKVEKGTDQEPEAMALEEYIKAQVTRLRGIAAKTLNLADDAVSFEVYADATPVSAAAVAGAVAPGSFTFLMSGHVKEIALGVLALASLLMVSQIVRKNAPAPSVVEQVAPKPPQPLPAAEETVGEAAEGGTMLDGMEVDEESVKAQQMLSQVSEMVEENPDAAAALVKRWLNRS